MMSMKHLPKSENWSLIALAGSVVLAYVLCFAPGHAHVFGDWNDPVSALTGIAVLSAVIVEVAMLFALSWRVR